MASHQDITAYRNDGTFDDDDITYRTNGGERSPLLGQSGSERLQGEEEEYRMVVASVPSYKTQYITAACATLGAFAMGSIIGYSSPASTSLTNSTDPNLNLTSSQLSWFSSTLNLGALVGGPVGGYCINFFGRRGTMIYSILPFVIGWVLLAAAQNFAMLILGRIVTGLCCGIVSLTVPTYIGEFSSPQIRGLLGSCFQLLVTIGILFSYVMGAAFDSFRWIAAVCLIIPCLHSLSMIPSKESPVFLLAKGREEDAKNALSYLRGKDYDITSELGVLKDTLEMNRQNKVSLKDLKGPYILKPLLISLGLMFFQQVSGINAVLFNLELIFAATGSSMSSTSSSIIVGFMQVVATVASALLMDRAGRKILLLVSSAFMAVSLVALGTYFYLKEIAGKSVDNLGWLPLVSLIIYIVAFSIGFGPIPWLMMGEIFSSDVREVAASIATSTNWTLSFVVTELFIPLQEAINNDGVYWMFAGCNVASFIFIIIFVFETKGKTIEEITAHFGGPVATSKSSQQEKYGDATNL